ncbi:hypothetical protein V8G69_13990 [Gaetbulibacter sp. M235]|uniref:hypothetical protein n=1 Tax=Gaetbulibacter sp. M235 TaxID=3126510 RepID=UPI00374FB29F
MIKLFRNIRKTLIKEGKTTNYLKYAIGEIVLVVIGILIALQINNWNTSRIASIEESEILSNINSEFKQNKENLNNDILLTAQSIATGKHIMSLINNDDEILKTKNIDSLLFAVFEYPGINISENTIIEIIQSGKFQNLTNTKLKQLIIDWTQKKNKAQSNLDDTKLNSKQLISYLYKRYPIKNIDAYGILKWKDNSTIIINKNLIFKDIEFENLVDDLLYKLVNLQEKLKILQDIIDAIIAESQTQK